MSDDPAITVRCSALERTIYLLLAVLPSGLVAAGLLLGWEPRPDAWKLAAIVVYLAVIFLFAFLSFRFVVRLDDKELFHRELVRRTLSLDKVQSIRVAEEYKLLGRIPHLKIEVVGEEGRILIGWRKKKLEPLVEALRGKFPGKIEAVDRLPDV